MKTRTTRKQGRWLPLGRGRLPCRAWMRWTTTLWLEEANRHSLEEESRGAWREGCTDGLLEGREKGEQGGGRPEPPDGG